MIHEIALPYPPVEEHPNFLGRIHSGSLVPGVRHYNPSICRHGLAVYMAYRVESYSAVSRVAICELNSEFAVKRTSVVPLPQTPGDCHWEDPRLCSAGGKLYLMAAYIRLVVPPICQQRLFEIDPFTFEPDAEIPLSFGKLGGIEKNWSPFELEDEKVGFVYSQRPRMVVEAESKVGHESAGVALAPPASSLSGRTGPLRIGGSYLEFVGGWIRIPVRAGRYWFTAKLIRGKAPYDVIGYIPAPLAWGSEASPTIFSPRPHGGHPCCVFPAGSMIEGSDIIVSLGVNDSYCCLMRFGISDLLSKMVPI